VSNNSSKNTAALSQLGNFYQYLIALKICLESDNGELVNIEKYGDLTTADYNYEIKHHIDSNNTLNETHIDFWKSISNWVDNRLILSEHSKYILLTSAIVKNESALSDWNELTPDDKLNKLCELKIKIESSDHKYEELRRKIKNIFNFSPSYKENDLKKVLSKIVLKHSYVNAESLYSEIVNGPYLKVIRENKRFPVIRSLLGFVVEKGILSPLEWDIEISEFTEFYRETIEKSLLGETLPFPDLNESISIDDATYGKTFIKKIGNIPYKKKIQEAALDYTVTQRTFSTMSFQNPSYLKKFNEEVKEAGRLLCNMKESICSDIESSDDKVLTKQSKKLYNNADSYLKTGNSPPIIQRGIIHTHVDSSEFQWKIKEEDLED
jgi:hypothetical protein